MTDKLPKLGLLAPVFSLKNQDGNLVKIKDFRGEKNIILYFYPKAMTPGCTVQACGLRDVKRQLSRLDTVVLGVSPDSWERLGRFAEKEGLNFDLLSDEDHKVAEKYGVWTLKKNYGREYMGIKRTTFLIDKAGKIQHIDDKVKTKTHHEQMVNFIKDNKETLS